MVNETMTENKTLLYVVTSVDEGIQLNSGVRLGFVGGGIDLPRFNEAIKILQEVLPLEEKQRIAVISSQEDQWQDDHLQSRNSLTIKDKYDELAAANDLYYAGHLDFGDPKVLLNDIKGHLVRPPKIHVADSIRFTCGGGEQVFNLRNYVISADWVFKADENLARELLAAQIDYCHMIAGRKLKFDYEIDGELDPKLAAINREFVEKIIKTI